MAVGFLVGCYFRCIRNINRELHMTQTSADECIASYLSYFRGDKDCPPNYGAKELRDILRKKGFVITKEKYYEPK